MPTIKRFDPETATHDYFKARHKYLTLRSQEEMPEDPPASLEFSITTAKNLKFLEKETFEVWHVWEGDEILAELFNSVGFYGHNEHLIHAELNILQPHRGKGYSKLLLPKLVEIAETYNRTSLICTTSSKIPAGGLVAEHFGAKKGMETHTNQLVLAEVDKALLEAWVANAKTSASEFELGLWTLYPEEEIVAVAKMIEVMNTAPKDELEVEDFKVSPEVLLQFNTYNKARNVAFWMLYVRHQLSGELAGYTQTYWDPETPENLSQGDTGILPKYRGHGLGKWLKAAMIQKVLAERPVVKRIRTGNADSNAAMLAINHALGFEPYIAHTVWQLEVQKIKDYLQKT